ncbi:haloacid dehalogenase, type II [Chromatiales bacterium (ex Bugula neritina AB1)]|nr:haloacid dehalogenase, type II [Chromatiales bacterium (ex Bugula neritina AB1)]
MKLTDFKALTFDCYGTLIDWESGMVSGLKPLTQQLQAPLTRDQILEAHARHESSQQRWTPGKRYSELLAIVYKRLADEWGISASVDECVEYGNSVKHWPAFPDSAGALQYLKKHFKLVILSNVDNHSFSGSNDRLKVEFDATYTAEDAGSYKPSDRNFEYMIEKIAALGIEKGDILHTAESMFHDHIPGKRHGLASCWIYRRYEQKGFGATMNPGEMPDVNFQFNSMADLVKAHQAEIRA